MLDAPLEPPFPEGFQQAIFGLGCFWGAERKFWESRGVYTTAVGYAGGFTPNPTYEEVCSGRTGHNEVVLVVFDPAKVSYETLLRVFWESHNPTQGMRQGNDVGTQYRSGIYVFDDAQRAAAKQSLDMYQERLQAEGHGDDHDRDPRRADLLLRRGLPPAVPRQEPDGVLRPRRHRRELPDRPHRSVLSERVATSGDWVRAATVRTCRMDTDEEADVSAYVDFTRKQWSRLRAATPLTLDEEDLLAPARPERAGRARGGRRGLPAAVAAAEPPVLGHP